MMRTSSFVHVYCSSGKLHTFVRKANIFYTSYIVSATVFPSFSTLFTSRSITSSSTDLNSAVCGVHSNNSGSSDYYASNEKCINASGIKLPRILFFGGGIVSYSTLSALYSRMYNIACTMLSDSDCAVHTSETSQLFSIEREELATETHREHSSHYKCKGELALQHAFAEQVVQDHLIVICPSLPERYTSVAEVVHKFRRQYPVLRFCVEKQLAVFPVDHHKSFTKSNLYKQMTGQLDVKDNKVTVLDTNSSNGPYAEETASERRAQEWKNSKHWRLSSYDLAVIVSFRYYLPNLLLSALPRVINVHPSLLPKYRGASPIESTLMHNEARGGVSIIKLTPHQTLMDSGDVLLQKEIPIPLSMDVRSYFPLISQTIETTLCGVIFGKKESSVKSLEKEQEEEVQGASCITNDTLDKNRTQDFENSTKCEGSEFSEHTAETCSSSNVCSSEQTYCDWPCTFDKLWSNAKRQTHTDYKHYKDDPFYAPLLPRHASAMQFEKQTALEVYGIWRAFVSYKHSATSSNALFDKFATPVGVQLLSRIMHRKEKEFNKCKSEERQNAEPHYKEQEKEHSELQYQQQHELQNQEKVNECTSVCKNNDNSGMTNTKFVELCSALYESGVAELCNTCSFVHAVHPSLVSPKVLKEMAVLSTASTPIEVKAVDFVKENSIAFSSINCIDDNVDEDDDELRTLDKCNKACDTLTNKQCTMQLADITPGTCYFPQADAELGAIKCAEDWFYWTMLHLKCAARPQKAGLLREGLAMKKGVLYHNLFRSIPVQY